jgi:hypothetical protein
MKRLILRKRGEAVGWRRFRPACAKRSGEGRAEPLAVWIQTYQGYENAWFYKIGDLASYKRTAF